MPKHLDLSARKSAILHTSALALLRQSLLVHGRFLALCFVVELVGKFASARIGRPEFGFNIFLFAIAFSLDNHRNVRYTYESSAHSCHLIAANRNSSQDFVLDSAAYSRELMDHLA